MIPGCSDGFGYASFELTSALVRTFLPLLPATLLLCAHGRRAASAPRYVNLGWIVATRIPGFFSCFSALFWEKSGLIWLKIVISVAVALCWKV